MPSFRDTCEGRQSLAVLTQDCTRLRNDVFIISLPYFVLGRIQVTCVEGHDRHETLSLVEHRTRHLYSRRAAPTPIEAPRGKDIANTRQHDHGQVRTRQREQGYGYHFVHDTCIKVEQRLACDPSRSPTRQEITQSCAVDTLCGIMSLPRIRREIRVSTHLWNRSKHCVQGLSTATSTQARRRAHPKGWRYFHVCPSFSRRMLFVSDDPAINSDSMNPTIPRQIIPLYITPRK